MPSAIPNGYRTPGPYPVFSSASDHPVEGFTGTLQGHPVVLTFYARYPLGLLVGVSYDHHPVYFGWGPSPIFAVVNFTQTVVVIGNPANAAYMAINLVTGSHTTNPNRLAPVFGFNGMHPPHHILGLPGTNYPVTVPYSVPAKS